MRFDLNEALRFIFIVFLSMSSSSYAASFVLTTENFSYHAEQEALSTILVDLAATELTPAIISDEVNEVVNLHYENIDAQEMFDDLTRIHNLMWYFDGYVLYVYKASEVVTATIKLNHTSPSRFAASLSELNVFDDRFDIQILEQHKLLLFAGSRRMVEVVMEMVTVLDVAQSPDQSAIYEWTDKNNITHFASSPPAGQSPDEVYYANQVVVPVGQVNQKEKGEADADQVNSLEDESLSLYSLNETGAINTGNQGNLKERVSFEGSLAFAKDTCDDFIQGECSGNNTKQLKPVESSKASTKELNFESSLENRNISNNCWMAVNQDTFDGKHQNSARPKGSLLDKALHQGEDCTFIDDAKNLAAEDKNNHSWLVFLGIESTQLEGLLDSNLNAAHERIELPQNNLQAGTY